MKTFLLLLAASAVAAKEVANVEDTTAFGYLTRFAIPEAERIRKEEDEVMKNRIVGGTPSTENQFPYQAGLVIDLINIQGNGVCGASLLTVNRLVTAAHCWFDGINQAWRFTVVLGSLYLFYGGTRIQTTDVIMHPQWNPDLIRNDVAMIRLDIPVSYSAAIQPIALPSGTELSENFAGYTGIASGFGLITSPGSISTNQYLSHVSLNIITNSVCWFAFPGSIQNSNICTSGTGGTSPCSGDSGGPLAVEYNGRRILAGIVSFGSGYGCSVGMPAVFARTTSFIDFINQNL